MGINRRVPRSYLFYLESFITNSMVLCLMFPMEKQIKISTQGRLTIPKQIRELLSIVDGQPVIIRSDSGRKEILLLLQPVISDYR